MSTDQILVVRIYLHETGSNWNEILRYLHDEAKVAGVTVYRGITGFGTDGKYHTASLLDISLDLPVVIEFFDCQEKIQPVINHLNTLVTPGHMIYWPAMINK